MLWLDPRADALLVELPAAPGDLLGSDAFYAVRILRFRQAARLGGACPDEKSGEPSGA
jgi:hypothetical protein